MTEAESSKPTPHECWLPPGEVLIHVGPRKTGSSAIQAALGDATDKLRSLDYFLAPKVVDGVRAAQGALYKGKRPYWRRSLAVVNERGDSGRGLISEEMLHRLSVDQGKRLVDRLGGPDQVRILITNRPLSKSMPSLWQQRVKTGFTSQSLKHWLRDLLGNPDHEGWLAQRLDYYFDHWAKILPTDRITILPVGYDHGDLIEEFEQLIGLPDQTLDRLIRNVSLTLQQAEMLRYRNQLLAEAGLERRRSKLFLQSTWARQDGTPVVLPEWARAQVAELQAEVVANIKERDAQIVGGYDRLLNIPRLPPHQPLSAADRKFARFAGEYTARLLEQLPVDLTSDGAG